MLTQAEYLAAKHEGSLVKHANGSWSATGETEVELLDRPLKRARHGVDVSAAASDAKAGVAKQRVQQGRRCAIM